MHEANARHGMFARLVAAAASDDRIVGLVDYGSGSAGRGDDWSDVDAALFIRDEDLARFARDWKPWAARFGSLLTAFISGVGHPWAIYDTGALPLRVDFAFWPASTIDQIGAWPNSPVSAEAMVRYDRTNGVLTGYARELVGKSLRPENLAETFERVCGSFWYYLLRTDAKMRRGQHWAARHDFDFAVLGNLFALLQLEAGAIDHWQGQSAAVGLEQALTPARLAQLEGCIAGPGMAGVQGALRAAARLGAEVCPAIAAHHAWPWPALLARRVQAILAS